MKDQSQNDDNDHDDHDHDHDHDDDNDNDNDNNVDDRIEATFQLLRDAKKYELEQRHWLATEKFVEAYQLLRILAEEENKKVADLATAAAATATATATATAQNDDTNNNEIGDDDDNDDNKDDGNKNNASEEEEKMKNIKQIAQLYTSKANEYWKQSRQCLIQAMEQEKKLDNNNNNNNKETISMSGNDFDTDACSLPCAPCTLLDDDQARIRNYNFSLLFSRPIVGSVLPPVGIVEENTTMTTIDYKEIPPREENPNNPTPTSLIDQQWSLEERLQNLNKTLPSSFKSTDERMSEVNKGLNKLGLSLYTQKEPFARFPTQELPKSEEEQIDEIMNQAKDEANVEEQIINNNNVNNNNNQSNKEEEEDEIFEDSVDDDDDDDEGDLLLDDDQLFMKSIQKKVVKAQIKLAELLAILNEARLMKAKEDDIDDDDDDDKDSDDDSSFNDDIAKTDLAFSLLTSKNKLKGAQRDMRKALAEFDNLSM
jgi:hypothetical protein